MLRREISKSRKETLSSPYTNLLLEREGGERMKESSIYAKKQEIEK